MTAPCELAPAAPVSSFTIRDLKLADGNLHGLAEQRPPSTARGWCAQQCDNGLDGPLGVDVLQFNLRNVRCLRQQRPRAMWAGPCATRTNNARASAGRNKSRRLALTERGFARYCSTHLVSRARVVSCSSRVRLQARP